MEVTAKMARRMVLPLLLLLAGEVVFGRPVVAISSSSSSSSSSSCVDDPDGLLLFLAENDINNNVPASAAKNAVVEGCDDALPYCENNGQPGRLARSYCCETCSRRRGGNGNNNINIINNNNNNVNNNNNNNVNNNNIFESGNAGNNGNNAFDNNDDGDLLLLPPSDEPVDLFLLGGQSECKGSARAADLRGASGRSRYPELQGTIDGVWFAGYRRGGGAGGGTTPDDPSSFTIRPMSATADGRGRFGPEVSFGERIRSATATNADANRDRNRSSNKKNVMIVKYCVGGTNVRSDWNPDTAANSWNERSDDGTSGWLESRTGFGKSKREIKERQFVNSIYTVRRTEEALDAAGISYEWAGIVWVQGNADNVRIGDRPVWMTFGENTARVWEGFRRHLKTTTTDFVVVVPVIDNGSNNQNQLKSGKEYAISIVEGGRAYNVEYGVTASDDTGTCRLGPTDPCVGADGWFLDGRILDDFGFDPNMFDDPDVDTTGKDESVDSFRWFVDYPTNVHSAYDGMVLNGRMLANAFLRAFRDPTTYDLSPYAATDVEAKFPFDRCPDGVVASRGNICWIDYREGVPTLAPVATTTTTTVPVPNETSPPSTAIPTAAAPTIPRPTTAVPTDAPTTARPTTAIPTAMPTPLPTAVPTATPMVIPMASPTTPPSTAIPTTAIPTPRPTTAIPTAMPPELPPPTAIPATATPPPTLRPTTAIPTTTAPTPAAIPTDAPTARPTTAIPAAVEPTPSPVPPDSVAAPPPVDVPTEAPTARPTAPPTAAPTAAPTKVPTAAPSATRTNPPTVPPPAVPSVTDDDGSTAPTGPPVSGTTTPPTDSDDDAGRTTASGTTHLTDDDDAIAEEEEEGTAGATHLEEDAVSEEEEEGSTTTISDDGTDGGLRAAPASSSSMSSSSPPGPIPRGPAGMVRIAAAVGFVTAAQLLPLLPTP